MLKYLLQTWLDCFLFIFLEVVKFYLLLFVIYELIMMLLFVYDREDLTSTAASDLFKYYVNGAHNNLCWPGGYPYVVELPSEAQFGRFRKDRRLGSIKSGILVV